MHMAFNRLPMFAQKPAPVQVAWLAYPGGTGLSAMDYRLTDAWMDPPGESGSILCRAVGAPAGLLVLLSSAWRCSAGGASRIGSRDVWVVE